MEEVVTVAQEESEEEYDEDEDDIASHKSRATQMSENSK